MGRLCVFLEIDGNSAEWGLYRKCDGHGRKSPAGSARDPLAILGMSNESGVSRKLQGMDTGGLANWQRLGPVSRSITHTHIRVGGGGEGSFTPRAWPWVGNLYRSICKGLLFRQRASTLLLCLIRRTARPALRVCVRDTVHPTTLEVACGAAGVPASAEPWHVLFLGASGARPRCWKAACNQPCWSVPSAVLKGVTGGGDEPG